MVYYALRDKSEWRSVVLLLRVFFFVAVSICGLVDQATLPADFRCNPELHEEVLQD